MASKLGVTALYVTPHSGKWGGPLTRRIAATGSTVAGPAPANRNAVCLQNASQANIGAGAILKVEGHSAPHFYFVPFFTGGHVPPSLQYELDVKSATF